MELINDVMVTSCMEISEITVAEEKERIRKIRFVHTPWSHQYSLFYREEEEKMLYNIAWSFVDGLIEHTTLNEISIIAKDSLESVESLVTCI